MIFIALERRQILTINITLRFIWYAFMVCHITQLVSDFLLQPFDFFEAWINLTGETERFFVYFKRVGGSRAVVICYQTGFAMSLSSLNLILEAENRTATQSQWDDTKARHEKKCYKHERE